MDLLKLFAVGSPGGMESLAPVVAVCLIFAGLLSAVMAGFFGHLDAKDKRAALVSAEINTVLRGLHRELSTLSEVTNRQNDALESLTDAFNSFARETPEPVAMEHG